MLTPVDIQQKKFHMGLGYEKKDVNTFLEEVTADYEQMFRSNAELKEQVTTLTDELQHYKTKEASLEKSILLAEKDSEDTKSRANKAAKTIELEAKNKAKSIVEDAEKRLTELEEKIKLLETQYAAYKSNFAILIKKQFEHLQINDFNTDAMIDERSLALLGVNASSGSGNNSSFGSFSGDPQMRDESSLGGMQGGSGGFGSSGNANSDSSVYTANLGANDNFVDPFNPDQKENGRYNPYADPNESKKPKNKNTANFKVASSGSSRSSSKKKTSQNSAKNTSSPSKAGE